MKRGNLSTGWDALLRSLGRLSACFPLLKRSLHEGKLKINKAFRKVSFAFGND